MKKELNIVGNRKIFFSVSIALILIGILCNIFLGVQLDISFKGGTLLKYSFTGDIDEPKLDALHHRHPEKGRGHHPVHRR